MGYCFTKVYVGVAVFLAVCRKDCYSNNLKMSRSPVFASFKIWFLISLSINHPCPLSGLALGGSSAAHSLSPRKTGENQKGKSEKLCYKDSLIGKAKATHQQSQIGIHSLRSIIRQLLSQLLYLVHMLYSLEYPIAHWRSAVLAPSPPIFLCTLSLLAIGETLEKTLNLCMHFSAIAKTLLCY